MEQKASVVSHIQLVDASYPSAFDLNVCLYLLHSTEDITAVCQKFWQKNTQFTNLELV